jgi:hydrocephalus-inducing protein
LDLVGSINFPNVKISSERISFGSTLSDTHKAETLTVSNISEVPVKYCWDLKHDSGSAASVDVGQIFDIKPVEGYLLPGEEEAVRVTYFARGGPQCSATAMLHVQGGPDTPVSLKAIPNHLAFSLEPKSIVIGPCVYNKVSYKEVTLVNTSKCAQHQGAFGFCCWTLTDKRHGTGFLLTGSTTGALSSAAASCSAAPPQEL